MRVLLTTDTVGGVWTYATELSRALARRGVVVLLATMGSDPTPAQRSEAEAIPGLRLFPSSYRLEWMEDPWDDVCRSGRWLLEIEREFRPDIVHLNGYCHGSLPWQTPTLVVGHSCVRSWHLAVRGTEAGHEWDRYTREVRRGLQLASQVAAPTCAMLRCLERYYGPLPPASVLPNGGDAKEFLPGEKEPFVFSAGRLWDEAKNLGTLAAAAPALSWPVYVAGEPVGPWGGSVTADGVTFLGRLEAPEMKTWLSRAGIYSLPARYEPFGLSALEAALSGCPLVLGDIPSLREVWGHAALYVPPNDSTALARAINRLASSEAERIARGNLARRRALGFSSCRMADLYMAKYRELLRSRAIRTAA